MALPIGAKPIGKHQIKSIELSEVTRNRSVRLVEEPVFVDIDHEAMARLSATRCLIDQCRIGAALPMEALRLIGVEDKNFRIYLGNFLENGWSIILAIIDPDKYIAESQVKIVVNELGDIAFFVACNGDDIATVWCDCLPAS